MFKDRSLMMRPTTAGGRLHAHGFPAFHCLLCDPPHPPQVKLAGAQHRQLVDLDEVIATREEKVGQPLRSQAFWGLVPLPIVERAKTPPFSPFAPPPPRRDGEDLFIRPDSLLQQLFDQPMRNHLAADF